MNSELTHTPEIFGSSIIALGSFNPAIFSADWLQQNNLIGSADAEDAKSKGSYVTSHKVTSVESKWFILQVLENQFSLSSNGALSPALKDLAVGILTLTPHTPVTAVGLNFFGHYKMASADEYHKVGDVLAPKKIWEEIFSDKDTSNGLTDLSIRIWPSPDRSALEPTGKQINISLQPSNVVHQGIFISYNDHYPIQVNKECGRSTAQMAANIVDNEWERTWEKSANAFNELISRALAQ